MLAWKKSNPNKLGIVNMSIGGAKNSALNQAINILINANITVCVAAGNETKNAINTSPASTLNAITVGAYDNKTPNKLATFSNYGSIVDILSPGVNIWSTYWKPDLKPDEYYFASLSGTSMASPVVTGTIVPLLNKQPKLNPIQIASNIKITSSKLFPAIYNSNKQGSNPRIILSNTANAAKTTNIGIWAGAY